MTENRDRMAAYKTLEAVFKSEAYSNIALNFNTDRDKVTNPAFVRGIVYGVIKYRKVLDFYIDQLVRDGVKSVISLDSFMGEGIPREILPEEVTDVLYGGGYQLMLVASEYVTATDEVNQQIDAINEIIHRYDEKAMLIGDAPCTKDLITISNHDFNVVNWASIGIIAAIIMFVFMSLSLPVLLVLVIECAIFINLGLAYYTGTSLPFIASIVIGTIQLGSTVDYAILMTSRYQVERASGKDRNEAVLIAHKTSIRSIVISAMSFFASTFGVGMYSGISVISSLCMLMARGALISMVTVVFALPSVLLLFDPLIVRTSRGFACKQ